MRRRVGSSPMPRTCREWPATGVLAADALAAAGGGEGLPVDAPPAGRPPRPSCATRARPRGAARGRARGAALGRRRPARRDGRARASRTRSARRRRPAAPAAAPADRQVVPHRRQIGPHHRAAAHGGLGRRGTQPLPAQEGQDGHRRRLDRAAPAPRASRTRSRVIRDAQLARDAARHPARRPTAGAGPRPRGRGRRESRPAEPGAAPGTSGVRRPGRRRGRSGPRLSAGRRRPRTASRPARPAAMTRAARERPRSRPG